MKSPLEVCVYVTFFIVAEVISKTSCERRLILNNNGPALLGDNITFSAQLLGYYTTSLLTFIFNDGVQKFEYSSTNLSVSVNASFPSELYVEGGYCMNVTAEVPELLIFEEKVASNFTCFQLNNLLIGEIVVYQGNSSNEDGLDEVAVGENFTAVLNLHDPNYYLKDATIDYGWSIDMDTYITIDNFFIYNFSDAGEKLILSRATASFPDSTTVFGYFNKTVAAKVPVNNVNITGNPFLHHGDFLMLNVSCNGTPPFEYCSEILKENVTLENFTCSQVTIFTTCHMEIKKFLTDGKYQIGIYIGNDVREVKRVMEVMVYNVTIKPTLSTVIIPLVCSLLTLIIIAIGISFYIQQKNQLAVEVANFDFVDESDSYAGERTFFEKIFDSFTCRNCGQNQLPCVGNRSESDPLLDDLESLPYV